jgi:hypothetical protein
MIEKHKAHRRKEEKTPQRTKKKERKWIKRKTRKDEGKTET